MSKDAPKKPSLVMKDEPQVFEDRIRERAYQLYEERGKEDGRDLDDWLRAEEEIRGSKAYSAAA